VAVGGRALLLGVVEDGEEVVGVRRRGEVEHPQMDGPSLRETDRRTDGLGPRGPRRHRLAPFAVDDEPRRRAVR
jgi:hypothetical protein